MKIFHSKESYVGIDIGSSSIKIVELKKEGGKARLLTYGFSENPLDLDKMNNQEIADVINEIYKKSDIVSRQTVSALSTFSVFSSIISLVGLGKKEKDIDSAVQWEAKKVIPLPLEEIILDWKKINNSKKNEKTIKEKDIKVLLTGAPKILVKKYVEIFKLAKINLLSLETETFALIRSLLGNDKSTVMIVEIGASTSNVTIVKESIPLLSRSVDVGGVTITGAISNNLNIGKERAEQFKYDMGIGTTDSQEESIPKTIIETISPIVNEIKYTIDTFQNKSDNKVEKIILTGGSALLSNLPGYLSKLLNLNVIIGDPWHRVSYPVDLEPSLKELGPRLAIAIGLAMREIE